MDTVGQVVIFGGTGFIGTHLTQHFIRQKLTTKITLVDVRPPRNEPYAALLQQGLASGRVEYVEWDVRSAARAPRLPARADLIINLAAIHREPGHQASEYFDVNVAGAENVCAYASAVDSPRIVFMSSIAPYGPSEEMKDEGSPPAPETPYGSSKLAAENIHLAWQSAAPGRKLLILRPGVVFGPGEGGNVTRLVRSVVKGYFVYMGNKRTTKAGGYVKELCLVALFGLDHLDSSGQSVALLNFTIDPPPRLEDYVNAARKVAGVGRSPWSVPRALLLAAAYPIDGLAKLIGIKQPVNPVRIRKLFRSTSIDPKRLRQLCYHWEFTLESAFQDWKNDLPEDFSR